MADVITRFKLETTQYDSRLRDASKALSNYTKQAELAGKQFGEYTQKNAEVARSLGQIATSASNTKDKVKELVDAYNNVAKAYNALTDEQKKSDFGKAMAESLNTLQGRIKEAKNEMNSTGGILGQLKEKFTINIDAIKLFNTGLTAAKAALDVAKDAFFKSEENVDEWGRTVEASESLYQGFLSALNNGDISGYLRSIDTITNAAKKAYDALDNLSTFNAFNQINVEKTRTNMTESIVDYREGNATKDVVKAAGEAYKKELVERQKLEKEAYLAKVREVAAQRGVNGNDLITALSGTYGRYQSLKSLPLSGTQTVFYGGGMFGGGGSYQKAVANSPQEKLGQALRQLNDTELQSLQALGAQAERTGNEIAQVDRQLSRVLNGRQGGGSGGGGGTTRKTGISGPTYAADSIAAQQALVAQLTKQWNEAGADVRNDYLAQLIAAEEVLKRMKNDAQMFRENAAGKLLGGDVLTSGLGSVTSFANYQIPQAGIANFKELPTEDIESMNKALKEQQMAFNLAGQAATNFGAALAGMGDPAAKAAGTVVAAIANIASGFAMASANANTAGTGWGWLAWLAAGMSAMATTISTIHSVTGFAEGGMIKGNSYSGDNIMANGGTIGLNAGEVVLNHAQQKTLARDLEEGGFGNLNIKGVLTGENIMLALDRHLQRSGIGELAVWR